VNAAVVLFCRQKGFLEVRTALDDARLMALAPGIDVAAVRAHLRALERVAAGDPEAGALARLDQSERFHWIVAPSSTIVQPSPVHTGFCDDPDAELDHLVATLVELSYVVPPRPMSR
jgi:hypothetical protein